VCCSIPDPETRHWKQASAGALGEFRATIAQLVACRGTELLFANESRTTWLDLSIDRYRCLFFAVRARLNESAGKIDAGRPPLRIME